MGFSERVARTLAPLAVRSGTWGELNAFFDQMGGGSASVKRITGKRVTPGTAIADSSTVFACISLNAETIGALPVETFRRVSARERQVIDPTPIRWPGSLARTVGISPNPEMTTQEYWSTVQGHVDAWGNHFSYIVRDVSTRPSELWPLRPDMMEVVRDVNADGYPIGKRQYVYTLPNGEKVGLNRDRVFHVMDYTTDGTKGLSRIEAARLQVGIEEAAAEYAGRFFGNSAIPGGIITAPRRLSNDETNQVRSTWQAIVGGLSAAQRVAVLHSGMDFKTIGIPPKDAQFIELRKYQVIELARMFNIPLHLLDETAATAWGSGIEQMTIAYAVYGLTPRVNRIEQAAGRDFGDVAANRLLADESLYVEFEVNALLRGDMETRAAFYKALWDMAAITSDEIRAFENLGPISGLDRPVRPLNVAPVGGDGETVQTEPLQPATPAGAELNAVRDRRELRSAVADLRAIAASLRNGNGDH